MEPCMDARQTCDDFLRLLRRAVFAHRSRCPQAIAYHRFRLLFSDRVWAVLRAGHRQ